ncbi:hypothetical protein FSP39_002900 [Pinctada imbricata]|uniref:Uncharacterized protein n=1 Tax=Pinctada imbricata TaxID=66713 RepID=A0AA88YAH8_PINIB|nr:hypothetical protein FSP39_002900 [Pinctada imbricata]
MQSLAEQKPSSGYQPLQLPPCRICTGVASGLHYGVNTCEACKAFFRRAMTDKYKYACARDGNCVITDRKRGNCSACRLKKCVEQGMSRDAVRHGRYTVAIRTKTILEVKQLEAENARKQLGSDGEMTSEGSVSSSPEASVTVDHMDPFDQPYSPLQLELQSEEFQADFNTDFLIDSPRNMTSDELLQGLDNSDDDQPVRKSARIASRRSSNVHTMLQDFDQTFKDLDLEEINIMPQDQLLVETLPFLDEEMAKAVNIVPEYDMSISDIEDLIKTLVEGHNAIYPRFRKQFDKKYVSRIQTEFYEQWQNERKSKTEIFGIKSSLSNEEYNSVYMATGIDVDGRMETIKKCLENIQKGIVDFISFSKSIPGFKDLKADDKLGLIKASRFEYWFLGHFVTVNNELGVSLGPDHKPSKMDECKRLFGCGDMVTRASEITATLQSLNLSCEEVCILRGIVLTFTDRCVLQEPNKVEEIQWNLIQCLKYLISKYHPEDSSSRRFSKYMDGLTVMRELTELNKKCNRQLEKLHWSIIKSYPLVYECYTSDKQEVERSEEETAGFLGNISYLATPKGSFIQL